MRLINTQTRGFEESEGDNVPSYAILFHRWEAEEVLYRDMQPGQQLPAKKGSKKLSMACDVAAREGHSYLRIDTCCIDKSSSAELSEGINSMYRWHEKSALCIVYLYDVPTVALAQSVWFTRGWTLQEFIAPRKAFFFDGSWNCLGDKNSLETQLSETTAINSMIIRASSSLGSVPIAVRISWAAGRKTTRVEDRAYSLLGLFDVNMPMLYGEGEKAFIRLQHELVKQSNDTSILLWSSEGISDTRLNVLAPSPDCFGSRRSSVPPLRVYDSHSSELFESRPFSITNLGLSIHLKLVLIAVDTYMAILDYCHYAFDREAELVGANRGFETFGSLGPRNIFPVMFWQRTQRSKYWGRIRWNEQAYTELEGHFLQRPDGQMMFLSSS